MRDLLFWSWVMGGTPLALALIQQAEYWWHDVMHAWTITRAPVAGERPAGDSGLQWTHS
jgi:hypothetical protein